MQRTLSIEKLMNCLRIYFEKAILTTFRVIHLFNLHALYSRQANAAQFEIVRYILMIEGFWTVIYCTLRIFDDDNFNFEF